MIHLFSILISPDFFRGFSLAGTLFAVTGSLIAAIFYRGKNGEPYSIFNHFISELGEKDVSRAAWSFNVGLVLSGVCLLPACISLGLLIPGAWAKIGMAFGIVSAVSLALVGVFPMNNITPHTRAAITYFRAGLGMVIFFTLAILLQAEIPLVLPRVYSLAGMPAIISFSTFLIYSSVAFKKQDEINEGEEKPRPRFWGIAVSEWSIFLTTVPFFLLLALGIKIT